MKVIKIKKSVRGGSIEHFLILPDNYTEDDIESDVLDWGESEGSGSNYGYRLDWNEVEDNIIIKKVCEDKLEKIRNNINQLHKEENKIMWFLGDRDKFEK